ncbi:hypothetical protein RA276_27865, partial [Pseudomonas syringae pv. tagetis]|uniref:hypothetical protein n=1 Tax=Pseudomonas syringae group genomosp. 7 TaxID=251699 RepID=UPI00376F988D
ICVLWGCLFGWVGVCCWCCCLCCVCLCSCWCEGCVFLVVVGCCCLWFVCCWLVLFFGGGVVLGCGFVIGFFVFHGCGLCGVPGLGPILLRISPETGYFAYIPCYLIQKIRNYF